MFLPISNKQSLSNIAGFTLLELLVVITLLAVVAGIAVISNSGVQEQGRIDVTKLEMAEMRKALLQFRRDSGSQAFPKQGIYDCDAIADDAIALGRPLTWTNVPPVTNLAERPAWISWCTHEANFWMLFEDPVGSGWDEDTRRGWNGPYLQRKSGYLQLSTSAAGLGIITSAPVWGVADPFVRDHQRQATGVDWSISPISDVLDRAGSPYVLFDLDVSVARIVSLGDNGSFDGDGTELCLPPLDPDASTALDNVLCLLR